MTPEDVRPILGYELNTGILVGYQINYALELIRKHPIGLKIKD
jgi:hypothetical protein